MIVSLERVRMGAEIRDAVLSEREAESLAEHLEWELQRARIRYDQQASGLRAFGVDPASVLGPRP